MQNAQEINWWWEILKVALPTLTALGVPYITYRSLTRKMADYQTVLSKEIEDYKKDISKELEVYKIQLQSDFQMQFYLFQTKFSLLHQERAKVIQKLFKLVTKIEIDLSLLGNEDIVQISKLELNTSMSEIVPDDYKDMAYQRMNDNLNKFFTFYTENKIVLTKFISDEIQKFYDKVLESITTYRVAIELTKPNAPLLGELSSAQRKKVLSENEKIARQLLREASPILEILQKEFTQLLNAQSLNSEIEKAK